MDYQKRISHQRVLTRGARPSLWENPDTPPTITPMGEVRVIPQGMTGDKIIIKTNKPKVRTKPTVTERRRNNRINLLYAKLEILYKKLQCAKGKAAYDIELDIQNAVIKLRDLGESIPLRIHSMQSIIEFFNLDNDR